MAHETTETIKHGETGTVKRALITATSLLVGVFSTFISGGAIAVAFQGKEEQRQLQVADEKIEKLADVMDLIQGSIVPMDIMNAAFLNSDRYIHTAVLLADEINTNSVSYTHLTLPTKA